jgi:hypothetical protein
MGLRFTPLRVLSVVRAHTAERKRERWALRFLGVFQRAPPSLAPPPFFFVFFLSFLSGDDESLL